MTTEQHEDYSLKYDDSPEAKERIYQIALKWFKKLDMFNGECLNQSDKTYEKAPEILTEIAEKGFRFKQKYSDE